MCSAQTKSQRTQIAFQGHPCCGSNEQRTVLSATTAGSCWRSVSGNQERNKVVSFNVQTFWLNFFLSDSAAATFISARRVFQNVAKGHCFFRVSSARSGSNNASTISGTSATYFWKENAFDQRIFSGILLFRWCLKTIQYWNSCSLSKFLHTWCCSRIVRFEIKLPLLHWVWIWLLF